MVEKIKVPLLSYELTALLETEEEHQAAQRLFRRSWRYEKSLSKIKDVEFGCPVLNFEYCSPVLQCRFPS